MAKQIVPTDPLFTQQWFLLNTGQDAGGLAQAAGAYRNDLSVTWVWPDYTGAGVRVAVLDDGVDGTHPDLAGHYLTALAYDVTDGVPNADPKTMDDSHGTAVAGLIGELRNGVGGVGVAYGADIVGYRGGGFGGRVQLGYFQAAADRALTDRVDVINNSWGAASGDRPLETAADQPGYQAAGARLATSGRDGLGTVIVFAGGNDRRTRFLTSYDPTNSLRYALNVAAASVDGTVSDYSTRGPNLLVAAPGSSPASIVTTDRVGADGYNPRKHGDYTDAPGTFFNGTSAAAPMVSGVVALMLQANPRLGYRDVQEILAASARAVAPGTDATNKAIAQRIATDWNGGDHPYSADLGFGNVDARAAVRLAETWTRQSTEANIASFTMQGPAGTVVAAGENDVLTLSPATAPAIKYLRAQHVTVAVDISVDRAGGLGALTLTLQDRLGREALLSDQPINTTATRLTYSFDVTAAWGSLFNTGKAAGEPGMQAEFELLVGNAAGGATATIDSVSVTAWGEAVTNDHTYVYTDDYAAMARLTPARERLSDPAPGRHTINAAAVSGDSVIDLRPGGTGSLGGACFETADGMTVASVYTGDGNDAIHGNALDNLLGAGRGINVIDGGGGFDTAVLIGSRAGFRLGLDGGGIVVASTDGGTRDTLTAIQSLQFADTTVSLAEARAGRIQVGAGAGQFGTENDGPVGYLRWQFITTVSDSLLVGAMGPDTFLHTGAGNDALAVVGGRNVLDGGTGSNWLVGGAGAADGADTFFLSGLLDAASPATWDTVVNFHGGDMLTVWGFDAGRDSYAWSDGLGAAGYTGATLSFSGNGREGMDKVTLAGLTSMDPTLAVTTGSVGGRSYLAVTHLG